jgi:16S rRNA (cytosine1402-N4)-methyltransferase
MINFKHYTVLLKESVQALNIKKDGVYIDGTVGGGGHSEMILKNLSPRGKLICIDKDPDALTYVKNKFASFDNVHVIKADFKNIPEVADSLNIEFID